MNEQTEQTEQVDLSPWCDLVRSFALPDTGGTVIEQVAALLEQLPTGDPGDTLPNLHAMFDTARAILANVHTRDRAHGSADPFRARVDMLTRPTDDGVPTVAPAPDPFTGDQHTVKRGRNKRGTTERVTSRGVASVQGARFRSVDGSHVRTDVVDRLLSIRRRANGWNALDVTAAAGDLFGDELPDLSGTDAMAWATVSLSDLSDVDEMGLHARHRCDLVGYLSTDDLAHDRDVYRAQTGNVLHAATRPDADPCGPVGIARPSLARHVERRRVNRPRVRASERATLAPFYGLRAYCRPFHPVTLRDLVTGYGQTHVIAGTSAPGDDDAPVFYGHSPLLPRGPVAPTTMAAANRGNRRRATVAANLPIPETVQGLEILCDMLNRGERVTLASGDYRVTLTRTTGDRWTSTVRHGDVTVRFTTRTREGIARKVWHATR